MGNNKIYYLSHIFIIVTLIIGFVSCKKDESPGNRILVSGIIKNVSAGENTGVFIEEEFPESTTTSSPVVKGSRQIVRGGSLVLQIQPLDLSDQILIGISELTDTACNYLNVGFYEQAKGYFSVDLNEAALKSAKGHRQNVPEISLEKIHLVRSMANNNNKSLHFEGGVYFLIISFYEINQFNSFYIKIATKSSNGISKVYIHKIMVNGMAGFSNNLQVSLNWAFPVDIDLHIETPDGNDIYYGIPIGQNGGMLDLDSNPACKIDDINNENITWGNYAPANGSYKVRADLWSACNSYGPFPYVVTVNNKGNVTTYTGEFVPSDETFGAAYSGRLIATFDFTK